MRASAGVCGGGGNQACGWEGITYPVPAGISLRFGGISLRFGVISLSGIPFRQEFIGECEGGNWKEEWDNLAGGNTDGNIKGPYMDGKCGKAYISQCEFAKDEKLLSEMEIGIE